MNTKLFGSVLTVALLCGASGVAMAQDPGQAAPKATAYTTKSKLIPSKLRNADQDVFDVRGNLTFTVTSANNDDTVAGTVTYTIPDDARQKIATQVGQPTIETIPASVTKENVTAGFQKATQPPILHLEIGSLELDVAAAKVRFARAVLDVDARDPNVAFTPYTNEEMDALLTKWAEQIAKGRARRGIISRMNKVIKGEPD